MKKTAFACFLLTLIVLSSCKKNHETFTTGIDVQSWFSKDIVQVFIDGQLIIDKQLETHPVLGVCYINEQTSIFKEKEKGNHEIKVVVNNVVTKTQTFSLTKNVYIGVNYNKQTQEISFVYSDQRFIYD